MSIMTTYRKWKLSKQLQRLEARLDVEAGLASTCDSCSRSVSPGDARYCPSCNRYFGYCCAGLGHGYCPKCKGMCGVNPKIVRWVEEADGVRAQLAHL